MIFYIDSSVWGGYYDTEFSEWTVPFVEQIKGGIFTGLISDVTLKEVLKAPENVRNLIESIPEEYLGLVEITREQEQLANHYVKEGALTEKHYADAQHVAIATTQKVEALISWNFRHMVNFFKIRQYNAVNLKLGYATIDIRTPKEVTYEKK